MTVTVVLGMQWGDEGKGKTVDLLTVNYDIVVRYSGGSNAGHTVYEGEGDEKFILHLIPSGILYHGKKNVLGDGMVIAPERLNQEIAELRERELLNGNLYVSNRAHLTLPHYYEIERQWEKLLNIGTTGRAIGPTYAFADMRVGIRTCDLYDERELRERVRQNLTLSRLFLSEDYPLSEEDTVSFLMRQLDNYGDYVSDVSFNLNNWIREGANILLEGAQGSHLDLTYGTYPHVTSSHPTAGGAPIGTGIGPTKIDKVVGVVKAYTTRVGEGEFTTRLGNADVQNVTRESEKEKITDSERIALREYALRTCDEEALARYLRVTADEYGATSGRPRKPGWLDLPALRYSARINGVTEMILTRLDILDDIDPIKVCTKYDVHGMFVDDVSEPFPALEADLRNAKPVYENRPGWNGSTYGMTEYGKLPSHARGYVQFVADEVGVPITIISTGPRRHETIMR